MSFTPYMISLAGALVKDRGITESSANLYIRNLCVMNGKTPFKSLAFLKKIETVEALIAHYAKNTKTSLYTSAVAALHTVKEKAGYKSLFATYTKKMMDAKGERREADASNEKSESQEKAWIEWADVLKKHAELKAEVDGFGKTLTSKQYDSLLRFVVLSMYVLLRPRRNADYLHLYVVPKYDESLEKDRNYYSLDDQKIRFNVFKTAKKASEDEKVVSVPPELQTILAQFIRHHPSGKGKKMFKLLVNADGSPLTAVNAITRILNKLFKKGVSSSMLRHSYLSGKYGSVLEDMKEDSALMAHSLDTQRNYIKTEGTE